jgi:hypothetical protein
MVKKQKSTKIFHPSSNRLGGGVWSSPDFLNALFRILNDIGKGKNCHILRL